MSIPARAAQRDRLPVSIEDFDAGRIDPQFFDHEAHVQIAWTYLRKYGLAEAIDSFSAALRRLTRSLGIESKYHETITWFFLILIAERRSASTPDDWDTFKCSNADLFASEPSIINRYYSAARLASDSARKQFVLPDRLPLP